MYENLAEKIFTPRKYSFNGFFNSKFVNKNYIELLNNTFNNYKMKDAKTMLLIPSTDLNNSQVYIQKKTIFI